jgi:hypothetical protein
MVLANLIPDHPQHIDYNAHKSLNGSAQRGFSSNLRDLVFWAELDHSAVRV